MNVAPRVDVVLVLLIIFMVVTPLLTKKMWMNVPHEPAEQAQPPPPDAPTPLVLTLGKDGVTRLNWEIVPREQLVERLRGALNARPDKVVFFAPDSATEYGKALEVLDTLKSGGIDTIAVLATADGAAGASAGGR